MREIRLKAMAKINLGLDVLRRREDGYHEVRMIMQTVRLHDRIRLQATKAPGIRMEVSLGYLPLSRIVVESLNIQRAGFGNLLLRVDGLGPLLQFALLHFLCADVGTAEEQAK